MIEYESICIRYTFEIDFEKNDKSNVEISAARLRCLPFTLEGIAKQHFSKSEILRNHQKCYTYLLNIPKRYAIFEKL